MVSKNCSEVNKALPQLCEAFRLKGTDGFVRGEYAHLKRPCIKGVDGTFIQANPVHLEAVINALGLDQANAAKTPS